MTEHDPVNHPTHYASEATCTGCGESIECIDVVRHKSFNIGNAIKYIWRAGKKEDEVQDLKKAIWYLQDQISLLEGSTNPNVHRLSKDDVLQVVYDANLNDARAVGHLVGAITTDVNARIEGLMSREETYGLEGASIVNKLLDEDWDIQSNSSKILIEDPVGYKNNECMWFETITPDGRAWICRNHDGLTRWAPRNGEPCDVVRSSPINEHAICYYEDSHRSGSHVCLEHGQTSKYGTSEGPNRACQAVDPWTINGLMDQTEGMSTTVNQDRFTRPFVHPDGTEVECNYGFVTGPGHSMTTGYYLCKSHGARTNRHPSEGANRPCEFIDPQNGNWGNVIPYPETEGHT